MWPGKGRGHEDRSKWGSLMETSIRSQSDRGNELASRYRQPLLYAHERGDLPATGADAFGLISSLICQSTPSCPLHKLLYFNLTLRGDTDACGGGPFFNHTISVVGQHWIGEEKTQGLVSDR